MSITLFLALIFSMFVLLMLDMCWLRYQQKEMQKHDQVLFLFCELRRDIMAFLHENAFQKSDTLSCEEYRFVRRLLNTLDDAIHNDNDHKTLMFNMRKMVKYIRQYRHTLKQSGALELTDNPEIQGFHTRFVLCLAKAFFAYTPLIRWELALKLVALTYRILHRATARRLRPQYVFAGAKVVRDTVHSGSRGLAT